MLKCEKGCDECWAQVFLHRKTWIKYLQNTEVRESVKIEQQQKILGSDFA